MAGARAGWRRPPRLRPSEYVDRDLIVPTGPLEGTRWTCHAFQREIMDAFDDPLIEEVVVMGSSQWGKTSIACGLVAYHMEHDPCPMMVVSPTEDPMAKAFSRERIEPLLRKTPSLAAVIDPRRDPEGTNTTLLKTFRGGVLALVRGPSRQSIASLRRIGAGLPLTPDPIGIAAELQADRFELAQPCSFPPPHLFE